MINQFRTVEDFISEESFQNFALKQDRASISRWQAYQKNHPEQDQLISEAIHFITLLAPPNIALSKAPENSKKKYLYLLALSACCIALFCIWFFSLSANVNEPILLSKTAVTENLNLIFPDQTEVELRKGSTIEYYQDWSSSESRKLWLNGEAYFDVSKATNSKDVFEVQTDKALIKVLGTKFLIRCNDDHLEVILEEGKIECLVGDQTISMKPGDLLNFNEEGVSVEHQHTIRTFDSWRSGKLTFKNVSIEEVIATINNSYHLNVSLGNPRLKNRKITATVDQNDPLLLLNAIAAIYDIELIEQSDKVILK